MGTIPNTPRSAFLDWCAAHADGFQANAAAIGITVAQANSFKAALTDATQAVTDQAIAQDSARSATANANAVVGTLRDQATAIVRSIKTFAENTNNPSVYIIANIPAPQPPSPVGPPGQPRDIRVSIAPNSGAITLSFKCTNPRGAAGTSYIVKRKIGGASAPGDYSFVGVTGQKTFTDDTLVAGPDSVAYTIQAQRSDATGAPSDAITINFGRLEGGGLAASVNGVSVPMKMAA